MSTTPAGTASLASSPHPPEFPAGPKPGPFGEKVTMADIGPSVESIATGGKRLREAVAGLSEAQLNTRYKNWTVRQIVHHLPDAHINVLVRWKLALTEDVPTIKPFSESAWSDLQVSKTGDLAAPLALMDAVHASWVSLIRTLTIQDLCKEFFHPELNKRVRLVDMLRTYGYHTDHHIGQIVWMRTAHGWG